MMKLKQLNVCLFFAVLAQQTLMAAVSANPTGATVVNGQVSFSQPDAATLQITNSHGSIINWQNFNIGAQELTRFVQQNATSAILNRVVGGNVSEILGKLQSNGKVFLINPNGLLIGQDAVIDTAGFIGSTLNITDQDFLNGRFHFEGDNAGDINNQGYIHAGENGDILLIAPNITNSGVLEVDGGNILLAAGKSITIASLDDANISFEVQAAEDTVVNLGEVIANNGAANMFAGTLTHTGSVSANAITTDAAGNIRLVAKDTAWVEGDVSATGNQGGSIQLLGEQVGLAGNAVVDASGANGGGEILVGGDYQGQGDVLTARASYVGEKVQIKADALQNGDGGKVIVWGDESTRMYGSISARGGALSGDGGFIETSGGFLDIGNLVPDVGASNGVGGTWLIDPFNITIAAAGSNGAGIIGGPIFESNANDAIIAIDTIQLALVNGDVTVQTGAGGAQAGNITWNSDAILDILGLGNGKTLTLNAHNDVVINGQIINQDPTNQNLNLTINADFDGDGQGSFTLGITGDLNLCPDLGVPCNAASIFKVNAGDGINMLGNVNATTNPGSLISLHTDTGLIDSTGILTTETLELSSTSAVNATINALSSSIANLTANMGTGSNIGYRANSGINLSGINAAGGTLTIDTANSALTQSGAIITGTLNITNAENVTLDNPANDVDTITASTSASASPLTFSFVDVDDLVVGDMSLVNNSTSLGSSTLILSSGGDMTLDGNISTVTSDPSTISEVILNAGNGGDIIHQSGRIFTEIVNFQNDGNATTTGAVGSAANPVQTAANSTSGIIEVNLGGIGRTSGLAESGGDLFLSNSAGIVSLFEYLTPTSSNLSIQNAGDIDLQGMLIVDSTGAFISGELTAASISLRSINGDLLLPLIGAFRPGLAGRMTSTVGDIFLQGNNLTIFTGSALNAAGDITLISNVGALTVADVVNSAAGSIFLNADSFVITEAVTAQDQVIVRELNAVNGLEVNDGVANVGFATLTTAALSQLTGTGGGIVLGNNVTHSGTRSVVLVSAIDSTMINGPRLSLNTTNTGTGSSIAKINAGIDFTGDNENLVLSGNGTAEIAPGSVPGDIVIDTGTGNFASTVSRLDIFGTADSSVIVRTSDAGITGDLNVSSGSLAGSSALLTGNNLALQGSLGIFGGGDGATVGFTGLVDITSPSFVDISAGTGVDGKARLLGGDINISADLARLLGGEGLNASAEIRASGNVRLDTSGNIQMQAGAGADSDAFISANGGLGAVVLNYAGCQGCENRLILNPTGNGRRDVGLHALNIVRNGVANGGAGRLDPTVVLRALSDRFTRARVRRVLEDEEERKKLLVCR